MSKALIRLRARGRARRPREDSDGILPDIDIRSQDGEPIHEDMGVRAAREEILADPNNFFKGAKGVPGRVLSEEEIERILHCAGRKEEKKIDFLCSCCGSEEYEEIRESNGVCGLGFRSWVVGYKCSGCSIRFDDVDKFRKKK